MARTEGPFFSAAEPTITALYVHRAQAAVAQEVHRTVNTFQHASFRYESSPPTGHAGRSVATRDLGEKHVITDSGIVYGHWLEGTGSRNATTRFKGYAIFRRTTQTVRGKAVRIANQAIRELCAALNA